VGRKLSLTLALLLAAFLVLNPGVSRSAVS
jgi:hypothetical protein